jgi:hypothetical protein
MIQLFMTLSNSLLLILALVLEDEDDCDVGEIRIKKPRPLVMARMPRMNT